MKKTQLKHLQKKIKSTFRSEDLLLSALTHPSHPSYSLYHDDETSFQRLEFLGDAVLNLYVARNLFKKFPEADEGLLSKLRSILVSKKILARVAHKIRLERFLLLGKREAELADQQKEKILADALEALIAAVFLDRGLKTAENFLHLYFSSYLNPKKLFELDPNPKSALQEYIQKEFHILPTYEIGRRKKDLFVAWVSIQNRLRTKGLGRSLRLAEAHAAANLLQKLRIRKRKLSFHSKTTPSA